MYFSLKKTPYEDQMLLPDAKALKAVDLNDAGKNSDDENHQRPLFYHQENDRVNVVGANWRK